MRKGLEFLLSGFLTLGSLLPVYGQQNQDFKPKNEEYSKIISEEKNVFSSKEQITKFEDVGGNVSKAKKLTGIMHPSGKEYFTSAKKMTDFLDDGGDITCAQEIAKLSLPDQSPFIKTSHALLTAQNLPICPSDIQALILLKGDDGKTLFPRIRWLKDFGNPEEPFQKGLLYQKIKKNNAKKLGKLLDLEIPDQYIIDCINKGLSSDELNIYFTHKILAKDIFSFTDTEKPNALVIYPSKDHNGAFKTKPSKDFFLSLRKTYDMYFVVASQESQVYQALKKIPDIEFLIFTGHGTKTSLSLGENDLATDDPENDETFMIDVSDKELKKYVKNVKSSAQILLLSCSNGSGGKGEKNLANMISDQIPGRQVTSSRMIFSVSQLKVISLDPFKGKIFFKSDELTYQIERKVYR